MYNISSVHSAHTVASTGCLLSISRYPHPTCVYVETVCHSGKSFLCSQVLGWAQLRSYTPSASWHSPLVYLYVQLQLWKPVLCALIGKHRGSHLTAMPVWLFFWSEYSLNLREPSQHSPVLWN